MPYVTSVDFRGDPKPAFAVAISVLTANAFRIVNKDATTLEFAGPGMANSRQSGLLGAKRIRFQSGGGRLELEADLAGVARMFLLATAFVLLVAVMMFFVTRGVIPPHPHPPRRGATGSTLLILRLQPLFPLAFWAVFGPVTYVLTKRRTIRALDTLLHNMVASGADA